MMMNFKGSFDYLFPC